MPKPNTRFLRHIIKDTDTHNKALLARESAESKARLEGLEQAEEAKRLKTNPNTRDIRKRQLGDIHAILGGGGRRRRIDNDKGKDKERSRDRDSDRAESSTKSRRGHTRSKPDDLIRDRHDDRKHHGRLGGSSRETHRDDDRRSRQSRDKTSGLKEDDHRRKRHSHRHHDRSRSPDHRHKHRRRTSDASESRHAKYRDRSPKSPRESHKSGSRRRRSSPTGHSASDSDPLDDLIGPVPAPKPRGRGALAGSSGIDRRFSETYDPRNDVQMDDDDGPGAKNDNWDDAVEAFRDRQKLKQNQETRLRSAGFAESDIQKIQSNTTGNGEKSEADVQWAKAGEKREWDKGKDYEDYADEHHLPGLLSEDM